jgi:tetratricopeptide (TPR) repeat protein
VRVVAGASGVPDALGASRQRAADRVGEVSARWIQAYKQGLYAEAEQQLIAALEEAERLGLPDQRLIVPLTTLALVYSAQDQPEKAEPLYQRLLLLRETALGPDHLEVAACLDNLAEVYEAQGQYARAEPFYQRALSIREKVL